MDIVIGVVLVAWAAVAVFASGIVTSFANRGRRVPYWGRPEIDPRSAILLRALGAPTLVFASVLLLGPAIGYGSVAVVVLAMLPWMLVTPIHNRVHARAAIAEEPQPAN